MYWLLCLLSTHKWCSVIACCYMSPPLLVHPMPLVLAELPPRHKVHTYTVYYWPYACTVSSSLPPSPFFPPFLSLHPSLLPSLLQPSAKTKKVMLPHLHPMMKYSPLNNGIHGNHMAPPPAMYTEGDIGISITYSRHSQQQQQQQQRPTPPLSHTLTTHTHTPTRQVTLINHLTLMTLKAFVYDCRHPSHLSHPQLPYMHLPHRMVPSFHFP